MNLYFDEELSNGYKNKAQIARVLTEAWVARNMFCPRCGNRHILHFGNNRPVADFYCEKCQNEYELKSKRSPFSSKIVDGAYGTMIRRINENTNPDFLLLHYSDNRVKNLTLIPKHFIIPSVIEERKPLSENARRAGWVGCNIMIGKIPLQGRIPIIENDTVAEIGSVVHQTSLAYKLEVQNIEARGWLMDVLNCVNAIPTVFFSISDIYKYEMQLQQMHPHNNNIKAKIRQQLQFLRDKGILEFLGNGLYRKV